MRFWTNRIPTNSSGDFSKLIEKVAAGRQQNVKTAAVKEADVTEPANTNDVEIRKDVHSLEGLEHDQNGEPEGDDEKKVVDSPSLKASAEEPVKKAQIAAPAAKPQARPQGKPQAKPAAPVAKAAPAPAAKPAVPGAKTAAPAAAKPAATAAKPVAAKPAAPGAAPAAKPVAQKPAVAPKSPALAEGEAQTKVADAPALGKGEGDGDNLDGVTKGRFPEPDREQMYKQEPEDDGTAKTNKESATVRKFEKISNLTPKAKSWLKRYWSMIYPSDYADAMTQDK